MNRQISSARRVILLGIFSLGFIVLWLLVLEPIKGSFGYIEQKIADSLQVKTRLESAIERLQNEPNGQATSEGMVWEGVQANLIQAEFQKTLSEQAANYQINFNSITPLSSGDVNAFQTVSLRVEGEASYAALLDFLGVVLNNQPKVAIESINLRALPNRQNTPEIFVSFQITLWATIRVLDPE